MVFGEGDKVCHIRSSIKETAEENARKSWKDLKIQNNLEIKMSAMTSNTVVEHGMGWKGPFKDPLAPSLCSE